MKTIIVIAPEGNIRGYLTNGKEYKAFNIENNVFKIKDDDRDTISCLFKQCEHLKGLDWIIKEEKPKKKVTVKATSLEANRKKDKASDQKLILSVLTTIESEAPTYGEIAKILKWEAVRVAKRMPELVELDKAKRMPVRKCKVRGTNCTTYVKIV